ncbi:MAG: DUF3127 domain-containing protein [Bacteroidales bacterium]|nr:DUF3127 domain-containing protein [Bacteroidales bacterium]MDD4685167.1 DUF3127 domain-containing protein [Bacteroidales bacterium]
MEIIGKFVKTLPEQRGTSQRGDWVRGGFVIETEEQYPKQLAFSLWGEDKVAIVRTMTIGTQLKVFFSPESREFNDKWFTDLRCFRIDVFGAINKTQQVAQPQQQTQSQYQSQYQAPQQANPPASETMEFTAPQEDDDLPF